MLLAAEAMNAVDVIVLVVLAVTFIYGVIRGFVLQLAGIVFIIGGLVLAGRFSGSFGETLHGWFPELGSPVDGIVAFCLIFLGTLIGGHVLALMFRGLLEKLKLLSYDRFLGGILGALKGGVLAGLILVGIVELLDRGEEDEEPIKVVQVIQDSRSWPLIESARDLIAPLIPEKHQGELRDLKDKARKKISPTPD